MLRSGGPGSLVGMDAVMRSRRHPRKATSRDFGGSEGRSEELSAARQYLGSPPPLVCLLDDLSMALDQLVSVTCVQVAGVVFLAGDHKFGFALAGAAVVGQGAILLSVLALRASGRLLCVVAVAEGRGDLPLRCVARERHGRGSR